MKNIEETLKIIKRGALELIPEDEFIAKLKQDRPLRVKWGADPSAPDIHLGHVVVLTKLRQLQDLGHEIIFLVGDFTARIGDPTGKSETRKPLTSEEVERNAKTYQDQVFKILDASKTKVVFNSHWLSKLKMEDVINLAGKYTVARMLERDDFMNRFEKERPISIHEFLYPLIQGYDSVELKADLEVGGSDQKFNMLVGRELQREFSQVPQCILTMPLLEGTDGVQKMSKSLDNYIGITEPAINIYSKILSISDVLMLRYYELLTLENMEQVKNQHPKDAKKRLAFMLTERFCGKSEAEKAEMDWVSMHEKKEILSEHREEIEHVNLDILPYEQKKEAIKSGVLSVAHFLSCSGIAPSISEARRLVNSSGIRVGGETAKLDWKINLKEPHDIDKGKKEHYHVLALDLSLIKL
ncbi:MAG: tyrosine--tRNA ligase [Candidatus Margulisiibacteriota bacterium]